MLPVSVIIPCFRCSSTIERAVESVYSQTQPPAHLVLVDDCSDDDTLPLLYRIQSKYGSDWVQVIAHKVNCGAAAARNTGWDQASDPYIAFLDADDSWHRRKVEIQYKYMVDNADVVLTGHSCDVVEGPVYELISPSVPTGIFEEKSFRKIIFKNYFQTPSVMVRRDVPQRFDPSRRFGEDYLLWMSIAAAGGRVAHSRDKLAFLHKPPFGASGLSAQMLKMEMGELSSFWTLRRQGMLPLHAAIAASAWSIVKYVRRVIVARRVW